MAAQTPRPPDPSREHAEVIGELHRAADERAGTHQRFIESLTGQLGRPRFVYTAIGGVALWIVANTFPGAFGGAAFDPPPFHALQGVVTVAAFLLTSLVLTTQQRQAQKSERRAQMDLHVNLLAEQKTAKLVALLEELRRDLPSVPDREDAVANVMSQAADPHAVLQALEQHLDGEPAEAARAATGADGEARLSCAAAKTAKDHPEDP